MGEYVLQTAINKELRELGIKFFHIENGRGRNRTHRAGWPDLLIFPGNERAFFVELKVDKNKLSDDQLLFIDWAKQMRYNIYTPRSMADWEAVKRVEKIV